jgi:hypothetical protein
MSNVRLFRQSRATWPRPLQRKHVISRVRPVVGAAPVAGAAPAGVAVFSRGVGLIPLDRGEVPDLSVSGDNFDLVGGDPHDLTTSIETRSANAIAEPTPDGYRPC